MAKPVDSIKKKKRTKKRKESKILAKLNAAANKPIKIKLKRTHYLIFGSVLTVFVLYFIFCIASDLTLKNRIYPNVWVGGVSVGNLTSQTAQEKLLQKSKAYFDETTLKISSDKELFELNPKDIDAQIDLNKTSQDLMKIGHNQNFLYAGLIRIRLIFKPINTFAAVNFNQEKWDNFTAEIAQKVDVPYQNASLKIENGVISEIPSSIGIKVEKLVLETKIKEEIGSFSNQEISLPKALAYPVIEKDDLLLARLDAEKMLAGPLEIVYKDKKYTANIDAISKWITFAEMPKNLVLGAKTEIDPVSNFITESDYILIAKLDEKIVREYINKIASEIDVAPKNAGLSFSSGSLKIVSPSVTGRSVDKDQLYLDIQNSIKNETYRKVTIKIVTKVPDIREDNLANLGIVELISEGISSFGGSPANRIHNIKTGASKFNGALIKPGEDFSFNKQLGQVNGSTGFLPELVIKENKTIPEFGGGLCQVSTTAFRAALLAGLPILERKEHAYRVKYYEWPYGPGVDATIYPPHPDMRFKNDTGHWILIQTGVSGSKLSFYFYGTKAGRSANINKPQILWSNPDGSLGTVFTRDVFVNGAKTRTDTFKSLFKSPSLFPKPAVETGAPVQQ